ncbi:MAG: ribosomal protein S18-alanine N-acetyltransferase [Oscillibacter sp.]|nr:ribosomal protein S18-alanine N-acetyltransferase [Oscillibacter sp.]
MPDKLSVRIVPMTADHLDEIAALEKQCFPDPWSRNLFAMELENDLAAWLVALDSAGAVVGYAGLQVVLDEGTITNIAVRPDWRHKGAASALLDVFLDFARGNNLAFVTLEVRASNYDAIALYGSRGFRAVGRRRNYYEYPKEDALIMTLYLNDRQPDGD